VTARSHAGRLVELLDEEVRADLADHPLTAIEGHLQLDVRPAAGFARRGHGGWCDGASIRKGSLILYRPTPGRRENFTLLHEVGHHLLDDDALSWIADQRDPNRLREQVCDLIASMLLVPEPIVDGILAAEAISARSIAALYGATSASRSACAVALAQRLPCDGFIVLVAKDEDTVFFGTRARDTRPYGWAGDPLPPAHPLRRSDPPDRTRTTWPFPNGDSREYFLSTAHHDGFVYAMFADNNLWGIPGLHFLEELEEDRGNDEKIRCPCGYEGTTRWWPCPKCKTPTCPQCKECDCIRRAKREATGRCTRCTLIVRAHLLVNGLCDDCR
jgi:hypothetical protein